MNARNNQLQNQEGNEIQKKYHFELISYNTVDYRKSVPPKLELYPPHRVQPSQKTVPLSYNCHTKGLTHRSAKVYPLGVSLAKKVLGNTLR